MSGTVSVTKSFILDATTLWMVDHANKQIIRNEVQSGVLPAAVSFLTGGSSITSRCKVALDSSGAFGTKGAVVLALTPLQPSAQYKHLYFVVDPSDWHVKESIVIDSSDDTNHFELFAPDLATPVKSSLFQVNPAALPNYKLIKVKP